MATSELDSEVEFRRRALQLGVSSTNIDSLIASGFKTFGQYAFSVPYQPGSADESPLVDMLTSSLSGEPDAGQLACLRRLFWEAHGLAVRDLRLRQEHGSDSEQTVIYVRPELCTSRAQETLQVKQAKTFALGSDGQLRITAKGDDLECSTAGEWKLRMALQRKSLAMDLAGLASFQVSEAWHTYLFTVREREVPKNMRPVTLQQILDADKRLWVLLAEEVRGKIVARPGANPTCDAVI
ncbi:kptA, partial [Symbiodinium sp. CCMP2456]